MMVVVQKKCEVQVAVSGRKVSKHSHINHNVTPWLEPVMRWPPLFKGFEEMLKVQMLIYRRLISICIDYNLSSPLEQDI